MRARKTRCTRPVGPKRGNVHQAPHDQANQHRPTSWSDLPALARRRAFRPGRSANTDAMKPVTLGEIASNRGAWRTMRGDHGIRPVWHMTDRIIIPENISIIRCQPNAQTLIRSENNWQVHAE